MPIEFEGPPGSLGDLARRGVKDQSLIRHKSMVHMTAYNSIGPTA